MNNDDYLGSARQILADKFRRHDPKALAASDFKEPEWLAELVSPAGPRGILGALVRPEPAVPPGEAMLVAGKLATVAEWVDRNANLAMVANSPEAVPGYMANRLAAVAQSAVVVPSSKSRNSSPSFLWAVQLGGYRTALLVDLLKESDTRKMAVNLRSIKGI